MEQYQPGLHILATFRAAPPALQDAAACRAFFDRVVSEQELVKVGEAYHRFPEGGFTGIVCLTESHLSIHTWPEFGQATFDVFLSNFRRDNSDKARAIYRDVLHRFAATEISKQEVWR